MNASSYSLGSLKVYVLKPEEKRRQKMYSILPKFSLSSDKLVVRYIVGHSSVTPRPDSGIAMQMRDGESYTASVRTGMYVCVCVCACVHPRMHLFC